MRVWFLDQLALVSKDEFPCCYLRPVCCGLLWRLRGNAQPLKGAWVASVYNLNFPSRVGLSPEIQKAQIRRLIEAAARSGLNALMVQVRAESDALYYSRIEPWSRYLTGMQGATPGYDPLDYFIRVGREHGIAIHAWINPYRAAANATETRASNHVSHQLVGAVHRIGSALWLDPGDPAVREHVVNVVRDIVERYPVAGTSWMTTSIHTPAAAIRKAPFPTTPSTRNTVAVSK